MQRSRSISHQDSVPFTPSLSVIKETFDGPSHGLTLTETADGYSLAPKETLSEALRERYGRRNDDADI